MLMRTYNEITRRRWYDIGLLILITLLSGLARLCVRSSLLDAAFMTSPADDVMWLLVGFGLALPVYWLVNELTHRHLQALVSAAVLVTMQGIICLRDQDVTQVWAYAFILGASYFALRGMRRYGAQWNDMLMGGLLLGFAIYLGGIWPLYNMLLPFAVVCIIATRPIMRYKWLSTAAALLLSLFVALLLFVFVMPFPYLGLWPDFFSSLSDDFAIWQDTGEEFNPWFVRLFKVSCLVSAGIWFFLGLVSVVYGLRSQRIHGDLSALTGTWWLILALVLVVLRPAFDESIMVALLVPLSFSIGAYFNFLSLFRRLRRRDRRVFRITLVITGVLFFFTSADRLFFTGFTTVSVLFVLIGLGVLAMLSVLVYRSRRKRKLPVRLVIALLLSGGLLFGIVSTLFPTLL